MRTLADTLSTLLLRLWPKRRQQELLLDLGERKAWGHEDRADAVGRLANWLASELLLTTPKCPADPPIHDDWRGLARALNAPIADRPAGVGTSTTTLAHLAGSSPKTLANWLTRGLLEERTDHRWVNLLARIAMGNVRPDALVFHRRSPRVVSEELARRVDATALDAGDALLVFSLVSLWQRRRRPGEARAARGTALPRRLLPKPVSALEGHLLVPSQLRPLVDADEFLPAAPAEALVAVALDAALTEAHLAPHVPHRSSAPPREGAGESWLLAIEEALARTHTLDPTDVSVFAWRVARMRAYGNHAPTPPPPDAVRDHPYVALARAIDVARGDPDQIATFDPAEAGYLMLLPQARRLGLVRESP